MSRPRLVFSCQNARDSGADGAPSRSETAPAAPLQIAGYQAQRRFRRAPIPQLGVFLGFFVLRRRVARIDLLRRYSFPEASPAISASISSFSEWNEKA
jgi:hypothetical protein